jgi:hypothetical protein
MSETNFDTQLAEAREEVKVAEHALADREAQRRRDEEDRMRATAAGGIAIRGGAGRYLAHGAKFTRDIALREAKPFGIGAALGVITAVSFWMLVGRRH